MLPLAAAALVGIAAAGERLNHLLAARVSTHAVMRYGVRRLPASGIVGSGVVLVCLLVLITLKASINPSINRQYDRAAR